MTSIYRHRERIKWMEILKALENLPQTIEVTRAFVIRKRENLHRYVSRFVAFHRYSHDSLT